MPHKAALRERLMATQFTKHRLSPKRLAVTEPAAVPALARLVSILAAQAARELLNSSLAVSDSGDTSATTPGSAVVSPEDDEG